MDISNKKKKAILRDHPAKSAEELAREHGLSERQVRAVLRQAGRLPGFSFRKYLVPAGAMLAVMAVAAAAFIYFTRPSRARLASIRPELNVLVITIDTLRADHLGCYGWKAAHTPNIDALARSGVRFSNAFSHQPLTLPSHATIFTGTHPAYHGIEDNGFFQLAPEAVTLAEVLKQNGYATGAVVSSFVLNRQFGLDQGFDNYDDTLDANRQMDAAGFESMKATSVSDRGTAWINAHAGQRWFLWLHYYDPHADYLPPERFRKLVSNDYDGEIAYVDFELGRVFKMLDQLGLRRKTLVVLTADHGESLGEHGEATHGLFLYDATQHVPLIFSLPGAIPAGGVRPRQFRLRDIMPTILGALGIDLPAEVQGEALVVRLYKVAPVEEERPVLMETSAPWDEYGFSPIYAIRYQGFKYIQAPKPELYDLTADPRELDNIVDQDKARAHEMAVLLDKMRKDLSRRRLAAGYAGMDEQARDRIASLGYVSAPAPTVPGTSVPDTKDMLPILNLMNRAATLKSQGKSAEAIALMEQALQTDPDSNRVLNRLGVWLAQDGQNEMARQYLERLIAKDPSFIEAYENLGQVYLNLGRFDDAKTMAWDMFKILPRSAKGYNLVGMADFMRRDYQSAIPQFQKAIKLYPTFHEAMANLGACYANQGDLKSALSWFEAALRVQPENPTYRRMVGNAKQQMLQ